MSTLDGVPGFTTWVVRVSSKGHASVVLVNSDDFKAGALVKELLQVAEPALKGPIYPPFGPLPKEGETPKAEPHPQP